MPTQLEVLSTTPASDSDDALVQAMREGETRAADLLIRRYHASLMRYLQRLVRDDHAAEELHQQTWISVLEHLDRFDSSASSGGFKAWLFRIATNKANDLWRSRGREKSANQQMRLMVDQVGPDAGFALEGQEQQIKLRRAIELLPENQKQVLLLRYYSDLKFVEIAETIGCPLNTALGRMHKAIIRLKQLMQDE